MDSNDLERERGITILAKNCAVRYEGTHINIVDTPGHADFGGEVERVLSMVDGVLLLVDAVEGPMPQTRFVTRKALALGLKPIVVVNKVDRPGARARVGGEPDLRPVRQARRHRGAARFPGGLRLGAAGRTPGRPRATRASDMKPLFEAILEHVPVRDEDPDAPLQLQICSLDYSSYVGKIGIGRIRRGRLQAPAQEVLVLNGRMQADQGQGQPGPDVRGPGARAGRGGGGGRHRARQRHRGGRHRRHAVRPRAPRGAAAAARSTSRR